MKRTFLLAGLVVTLLCGPVASAQDTRTQWTPIEKSMTALLNEGWRLISHSDTSDSYHRAFSFVLSKENKLVICLIDKPEANNAASICRALN